MRFVPLLALLASCGGNPGARSPLNLETEMSGECEAAEFVRAEWSERLGESLPSLPEIRWFEGDPLTYKGLTLKVHSVYWSGADEIQLTVSSVNANGHPSGTDIAHEMLHWALYRTTGDGDAGHEGPLWSSVKDVTADLLERGL